ALTTYRRQRHALFPYTTLFRSKPGVRNVRESHADAHPVAHGARDVQARAELDRTTEVDVASSAIGTDGEPGGEPPLLRDVEIARSEEHTSELQSRFDLVCRLLL